MAIKEKVLHMMGTVIHLWLQHEKPEPLLAKAEEMLIDYEGHFSANDNRSALMQLNQQAASHFVKVDKELFELISIGKEQSLMTDSFLNIALGPLVKEWRIGFKDAHYPEAHQIKGLLQLTNPADILLNEAERTVAFRQQGMEIDLGALAKGYFADKIIAFFRREGAQAAYIDLGGNVLTFGEAPFHEDGYWRVGVQNPFLPRNQYAAVVKIKNQSVVTSGIYERKFEWQGKTYHHIFDPHTGFPIQSSLASLTIVSKQSLDGEIWTTRLYGKTPSTIITDLNSIPTIEGLVITNQGELAFSQGLKKNIELS
ncbi:FAD:protein FMN transferase [Enterococcus sp. DIV0800]|uniref:FAD:protein FMN transferase n=1 Tax=unclassified Enterococcus TaxID=2608891 RepID=UPI003D2FF962